MTTRDDLSAAACAPSISADDYAAHLRAVAEKERADAWVVLRVAVLTPGAHRDLDDWGRIRAACVWCGAAPMPGAGLCAGCDAARAGAPLPGVST